VRERGIPGADPDGAATLVGLGSAPLKAGLHALTLGFGSGTI
jgi:hypothetical protein